MVDGSGDVRAPEAVLGPPAFSLVASRILAIASSLAHRWDMCDCKTRNAPSNENRPHVADLQILK